MRKSTVRALVVVLSCGVAIGIAAARPISKPKYTIKEVMKVAHKEKLVNKVQEGQASKDEKEKLLSLYVALYENKPPKGDQASWTEKTSSLVVAGAKALLGEEDAGEALKNAANCMGCHKAHK